MDGAKFFILIFMLGMIFGELMDIDHNTYGLKSIYHSQKTEKEISK